MNLNLGNLLVLLSISSISGCAAPTATRVQAAGVLRGECLKLFTDGSLGSYQHVTHQLMGKVVFALGVDPDTGTQRCGIGRSYMDAGQRVAGFGSPATWEQLEAVAIARCEASATSRAPCRVFARNNEIVWNIKRDLDFR